jgi:hypothetical protein
LTRSSSPHTALNHCPSRRRHLSAASSHCHRFLLQLRPPPPSQSTWTRTSREKEGSSNVPGHTRSRYILFYRAVDLSFNEAEIYFICIKILFCWPNILFYWSNIFYVTLRCGNAAASMARAYPFSNCKRGGHGAHHRSGSVAVLPAPDGSCSPPMHLPRNFETSRSTVSPR